VRPWVPDGTRAVRAGQELFALIDGGAELFLRHGFERAAVQSYSLASDRHIQVEIYMMQGADGAAEVFARKTGPENPRWPLAMPAQPASTMSSFAAVDSWSRCRWPATRRTDAKATILRIARAIENRIPARVP